MSREELQQKINEVKDNEYIFGISIGEIENEEFGIDSSIVCISTKLYFENRDLVDDYVKYFCIKDRSNFILRNLYIISDYHITDEYLQLIANNSTIEKVILEKVSEDYKLTLNDFNILKSNPSIEEISTRFVEEKLENVYDERLTAVMRKKVKEFLSVREVLYNDDLYFFGSITEEEKLNIIKYLTERKKNGTINFSYNNDGQTIKDIIDFMEEKDKDSKTKTKFSIEIQERDKFDYSIFIDLEQNSRINIITETDEITDLNTYIKVEEKIKELIGPIKQIENKLSPFEKILWLYIEVSNFREYKEEATDEDWRESRLLHKLLFNDKIVCAGYSFLLSDLAKRLNLDICESYANFENSKNGNLFNHLLNLISIKDEEYDIDGLYLLDVTQDNYKLDNFYILNHFLISPNKYKKYIGDVYVAGFSMLNAKDFNEFKTMAERDRFSLNSLIEILRKKFQDNEMFRAEFSSNESFFAYYISKLKELHKLSNNFHVNDISIEDIIRALTKIEELKNPEISNEELQTKVKNTLELFIERDKRIYNEETLQKKLSEMEVKPQK